MRYLLIATCFIGALALNALEPFTGQVIADKVRMRHLPSLDGQVVRELSKGDLFLVLDEVDDFFAVAPPSDIKGFIFRTYVLDGVVEGTRVNVRLEPELEAPVIAQLNGGEQVDGQISPLNNKWLEITPPEGAHFFIAKEYVERAGDKNLLAQMEERKEALTTELATLTAQVQEELAKPFTEIAYNPLKERFHYLFDHYADFAAQIKQAKVTLAQFEEQYLNQKIAYLEAQAKQGIVPVSTERQTVVATGSTDLTEWQNTEALVFAHWAEKHSGATMEDFYRVQHQHSQQLSGIVEPFNRTIKNKPGNFVLLNPNTRLPIAYLYSTQVDLAKLVGREVTLKGSERPNHHFAYPSFFVLAD